MDELGKILQNYEEMYNSARVRFLNSHITLDQEHELFIMADKYAHSAIIAWVEEEILPEELKGNEDMIITKSPAYVAGHNFCLQEIKARLHE